MSETRTCDARCHKAKLSKCTCWCGGLFHGGAGKAAREAFAGEFQQLPETADDFDHLTQQQGLFNAGAGERFQSALVAARRARGLPETAAT